MRGTNWSEGRERGCEGQGSDGGEVTLGGRHTVRGNTGSEGRRLATMESSTLTLCSIVAGKSVDSKRV